MRPRWVSLGGFHKPRGIHWAPVGRELRIGMGKRRNGLDLAWSWKRKGVVGTDYRLDYCSSGLLDCWAFTI